MNRTDWIEQAAEQAGVKKSVALELLRMGLEVITEELANNQKVRLADFGSFAVCEHRRANRGFRGGRRGSVYSERTAAFQASRALVRRLCGRREMQAQ